MSDEGKTPSGDSVSQDAGTEGGDKGGRGLSEILAEYDKKASGTGAESGKGGDKSLEDRLKAVEGNLSAMQTTQTRESAMREIQETVTPLLKGNLESGIKSDDWVKNWFLDQLEQDAKLMELAENRDSHRLLFKEAVEKLRPQFREWAIEQGYAKEAEQPNAGKSLSSAVRSARETGSSSPAGYEDVDWGNLSDQDFAAKADEVIRLAEAGQL